MTPGLHFNFKYILILVRDLVHSAVQFVDKQLLWNGQPLSLVVLYG